MPEQNPTSLEHLHVVLRALAQAVRLQELALGLQLGGALVELGADLGHRALHRPFLDVVVRGRPDGHVLQVVADELAGQGVEVLQALDLVAEQHGPERRLLVGREDLQRVAAHAERAAAERRVVAVVLEVDELAQQLVAVDLAALDDHLAVVVVGLRRAQAEDARHGGHDDHVPAGEQRRRGGVAQPVDLLVDGRVLLDVQVLRGDVGLGLVVVVVGDEVLDRVVREVRPELVAELRGERLVVGDDERRALHGLDGRRHRHRLARAGGAQQGQPALVRLDALGQRRDGRRLVRGGRIDGVELEGRHGPMNSSGPAGRIRRRRRAPGRRRAARAGSARNGAARACGGRTGGALGPLRCPRCRPAVRTTARTT